MAITEQTIATPVAILQYPVLEEPKAELNNGGKPKFSATLILDPADCAPIVAAIKLCYQHSGAGARSVKNPLRDGNEKADDWGEEFRNKKFLKVSTIYQPTFCDAHKSPIPASAFYAGCKVKAAITPFWYSASGNNGVGFRLGALQFIADGEPLQSGGNATDVFVDEGGSAPAGQPADTSFDPDMFEGADAAPAEDPMFV